MTAARRHCRIPTIAELGYPGFEVISWWGLLGQAAVRAGEWGQAIKDSGARID